jgi:hypothetical protein
MARLRAVFKQREARLVESFNLSSVPYAKLVIVDEFAFPEQGLLSFTRVTLKYGWLGSC